MRPMKILVVPLVLAAAFAAQFALPAGKNPAPSQPVSDQGVTVLVGATDKKGIPLGELTKDQVSVSDGNQPAQTLTVQNASDLPLDLGIVLLASKKKFDQEQAAANDLAKRVLRPGKDKAFVITANGEKPWTNSHIAWLTDASSVAEAVHGLDKNTGLPDLFNYQLSTDAAGLGRMSVQTYNLGTGFSVFDVIWAMMKNDPRPARRVVMIFRLATAHSPGLTPQGSNVGNASSGSMANSGGGAPIDSSQSVTTSTEGTHSRVIAIAQSLGISFFTVGLEDPVQAVDDNSNITNTYMPTHGGGNDADARRYDRDMVRQRNLQYLAGRHNVERIADETGGRSYWSDKKNYTDAMTGIANEVAAQYVVSFAPSTASSAGQVHPIKVQVAGAAHVSAPRAYIMQAP
jgi:VWFA-related protein